MIKSLSKIIVILVTLYTGICISLYFFQEQIIFSPQSLPKDYQFQFDQPFQEQNIKVKDGKTINGLLFTSDRSKGLIFYLHGKTRPLSRWGHIAKIYTKLGFDIFIFDYREYGKSQGEISNQNQLFQDHQIVYNYIKTIYPEDNIIIVGYSIGSGFAAKLAADNNPAHLLLKAPYYSMVDMVQRRVPFVPTFILKYPLRTYQYLYNINIPVTIIHGDKDSVIPFESSSMLKKVLKDKVCLIKLHGVGHARLNNNKKYIEALKKHVLAPYESY